ncbi:MAG: hypothetical protein HYZ49_13860 [Chloroflexi bacterium]|nr:hypothetical protein [Chloroflexota bacterium]
MNAAPHSAKQFHRYQARTALLALLLIAQLAFGWFPASSAGIIPAPALPAGNDPTYFPIGVGSSDVISHQLVRTNTDRLYAFSSRQYTTTLFAYWTTAPGLPDAQTAFDGSATVADSANLISIDAVYDGSNTIHVLVNTQAGALKDYPFDTTANTFRPALTLATGNPTVSGDYIGSAGVSGMVDLSGTLHVAYWSSDNHITHVSYTYDSLANSLTPVGAATQVDVSGNANHPSVAISPLDNSLTIAWVSEAGTPKKILARVRAANGAWGSVEEVSASPVWTSANGGLNIDQGPSLVIGADGVKHLTYIENYDGSGDYGRIHYATNSGAGWVDQPLAAYTHNPTLALNSAGEVYIIGHGHPNNPACLDLRDMCVMQKNGDGSWTAPQLFAAHTGLDSFDASPSVKWSAIGFNRPETVEFVFFRADSGNYNNPTLFYGRLATPVPPTPTGTPTLAPSATSTSEAVATNTDTPLPPADTATHTATSTATNTPTATATSGPTIITILVSTSSDDANQDGATLSLTSPTVWLGNGSSTTSSYTGLRFNALSIPQGATITSAHLEVFSSQSQWLSINLSIAAEAAGNSPTYSTGNLPSQRILTTQRVAHTSNTQWLSSTWYSLNEMKLVIQEVVSRADWQSGNSLSVILKGTGGSWGRKFVGGYDGSIANAPKLVINYVAAGGATNTPTFTSTATATFTSTSTATATATNTPLPTFTPLPTDTPTSTATFTPTDIILATDTPTSTPTASATDTPLPIVTATNTLPPTETPTSTPTELPTDTPTFAPTPTDTPAATATPTSTFPPTATVTNTPGPTDTPTSTATSTPTNTAPPTFTATATFTNTPLPTFTPTPASACLYSPGISGGAGTYFDAQAENWMSNLPGAGSLAGKNWSSVTSPTGYFGASAMQSLPNSGVSSGDATTGPRLDYRLNFPATGAYYVYVRGRADSLNASGSDSIHVGLNGVAVTLGAQGVTGYTSGNYTWRRTYGGNAVTLTISTAGTHTLNIWMREDGTIVDEIVVSTINNLSTTTLNGLADSAGWAASCSGGTFATATPTAMFTATIAPSLTPTFTPTSAGAPALLLGVQTIGSNQDNNPAGLAEAFQYTASASGAANQLYVYVDGNNAATQVIVGLYTNTVTDDPGNLLAQATITSPTPGAWNLAAIPATNLTAGTKYWIAVLGPTGAGTVQFRDMASGSKAQTNAASNLTALPAAWSPGTTFANSPLSAYAVQSP